MNNIFYTNLDAFRDFWELNEPPIIENVLVLNDTVTKTSDTVAKENNTVTNTSDTVAKENNTVTNTSDTVTKENNTVTNTSDTVTKENNAVTNTSDTVAKENNAVTNTSDTVTKENNAVTNTSDTVTKENNIITKTNDTLIKGDTQTVKIDKAQENLIREQESAIEKMPETSSVDNKTFVQDKRHEGLIFPGNKKIQNRNRIVPQITGDIELPNPINLNPMDYDLNINQYIKEEDLEKFIVPMDTPDVSTIEVEKALVRDYSKEKQNTGKNQIVDISTSEIVKKAMEACDIAQQKYDAILERLNKMDNEYKENATTERLIIKEISTCVRSHTSKMSALRKRMEGAVKNINVELCRLKKLPYYPQTTPSSFQQEDEYTVFNNNKDQEKMKGEISPAQTTPSSFQQEDEYTVFNNNKDQEKMKGEISPAQTTPSPFQQEDEYTVFNNNKDQEKMKGEISPAQTNYKIIDDNKEATTPTLFTRACTWFSKLPLLTKMRTVWYSWFNGLVSFLKNYT